MVEHAKAAFELMEQNPAMECAKAVWNRLQHTENFTARDALDKVKGRFKSMKEVEPGLEVLLDYGLIIELEPPKKRGRPSRQFEVNPKAKRG